MPIRPSAQHAVLARVGQLVGDGAVLVGRGLVGPLHSAPAVPDGQQVDDDVGQDQRRASPPGSGPWGCCPSAGAPGRRQTVAAGFPYGLAGGRRTRPSSPSSPSWPPMPPSPRTSAVRGDGRGRAARVARPRGTAGSSAAREDVDAFLLGHAPQQFPSSGPVSGLPPAVERYLAWLEAPAACAAEFARPARSGGRARRRVRRRAADPERPGSRGCGRDGGPAGVEHRDPAAVQAWTAELEAPCGSAAAGWPPRAPGLAQPRRRAGRARLVLGDVLIRVVGGAHERAAGGVLEAEPQASASRAANSSGCQ